MTAPLIIDGWVCKLYPENARGAVRQDGRGVLLHANGALSGNDCYVPPAVMHWLVKPLMHAAWEPKFAINQPVVLTADNRGKLRGVVERIGGPAGTYYVRVRRGPSGGTWGEWFSESELEAAPEQSPPIANKALTAEALASSRLDGETVPVEQPKRCRACGDPIGDVRYQGCMSCVSIANKPKLEQAGAAEGELCHKCGAAANINDGDDQEGRCGPPVCVNCYDPNWQPAADAEAKDSDPTAGTAEDAPASKPITAAVRGSGAEPRGVEETGQPTEAVNPSSASTSEAAGDELPDCSVPGCGEE